MKVSTAHMVAARLWITRQSVIVNKVILLVLMAPAKMSTNVKRILVTEQQPVEIPLAVLTVHVLRD